MPTYRHILTPLEVTWWFHPNEAIRTSQRTAIMRRVAGEAIAQGHE